MNFAELMQERKKLLQTEKAQTEAECKRRLQLIDTEYKELEQTKSRLLQELESAQGTQKKALKTLLGKISIYMDRSRKHQADIQRKTDERIAGIKRSLAVIEGKRGTLVEFGTAPYSHGKEPLQWAIVSCDDQKVRLICVNTVGVSSYGGAVKWLQESEFLDSFSKEEKLVMDGNASVPTEEEANATGSLYTRPTNALREHEISKAREDGRRFGYNNLQVQNSIKDKLERCEPYWLLTQSSRDGFSNYVGQSVDGKKWFAARIGSLAPFAIRPVITVDRIALLTLQK